MCVSTKYFINNFILDACPNIIFMMTSINQKEVDMINYMKKKLILDYNSSFK